MLSLCLAPNIRLFARISRLSFIIPYLWYRKLCAMMNHRGVSLRPLTGLVYLFTLTQLLEKQGSIDCDIYCINLTIPSGYFTRPLPSPTLCNCWQQLYSTPKEFQAKVWLTDAILVLKKGTYVFMLPSLSLTFFAPAFFFFPFTYERAVDLACLVALWFLPDSLLDLLVFYYRFLVWPLSAFTHLL